MAATTKKMLITFHPEGTNGGSSDFLLPLLADGRVSLWGLRSRRPQEFGLVVFTGQGLSDADLLARLVDAGVTIPDVSEQMGVLGDHIAAMQSTRIGEVRRVPTEGIEADRFELERTALKPGGKTRRLP